MSNFVTYKASAGSGKTYTLAVEYIKQLLLSEEAHAHRHILAVTFTKDATGEMKDRIIAELYGLAAGLAESNGFLQSLQQVLAEAGKSFQDDVVRQKAKVALTDILHDYSRFYVGTIDSFFQRVLRNLARELGKGSKFNIELNTIKVIDEAVNAMIEKSNKDPKLLDWIGRYIEEKIEQGQSWRVDRELKSFGMNIFNEYFQEHEMDLRKQLEENPKLIDEMIKTHKQLKDAFEKQMQAFANLFFKILKDNKISPYNLSGGGKNVGYVASYYNKILNGKYSDDICGSTIQKAMDDASKWAGTKASASQKSEINYLAESVLMGHLQDTEDYRTQRLMDYNSSVLVLKNIHQLGLLWNIALEMETQNKENNRFMLSQTALFLNQMIADSDASFVYEKIGSEIKHVMIDEFQDTSRLQWHNFRSLLSEIIANNNFSLVVGDVKQSIYRWRNGDWSILNSIENLLDTVSKTLGTNYRSQKRVVDFNNQFFVQAAEQLGQQLYDEFESTVVSPFETAYLAETVEQKSARDKEQGYVFIDFIAENKEEKISYKEASLQRLLEKLESFHETGVDAPQICMLTRTNREIMEIAAFLAAQKEAYPVLAEARYLDIISNDAFQLAASPTLKIIVEALRSIADWENPVPRAQLLLMWLELTNKAQMVDLHYLLRHGDGMDALLPHGFRKADYAQLEVMPLYELILFIYRVFELEKMPHQSSYLYFFLDNLVSYLNQNTSDITAFLAYWDEEMQFKSVPTETGLSGVRAMTIHKSKGLQFHTVILPFCDWEMAKYSNFRQKSLVWCDKKNEPFNLEILPIEYSATMKQSVFATEYAEETAQLWMDNLNVLYVAFTRAEHNLCILSKASTGTSKRTLISDLISNLTKSRNLPGVFDEERQQLTYGEISAERENDSDKENVLKYNTKKYSVAVDFVSHAILYKDNIFRQSNKSKQFIASGEAPQENQYIRNGNIMHTLFSNIKTIADIPTAVEKLIFEGLITHAEKESYIRQVEDAITASGVENWFSSSYTLFNECLILTRDENNNTRTRRPDRVMVNQNEVLVVDYKLGEAHARHQKQVKEYISLLHEMGYANVTGYLWYVAENRIEEV
ncbi:MAG: UvrD-helicase domain-containing protein [Paludibacteraceae bacterium]|nr:UvrD-helicase domain-containing protein [Paludibacteraceae bacterium]